MDFAASKPSIKKRPKRGPTKVGADLGFKPNSLAINAKTMGHRGT
jgi:hypothetical protein